VPLEQRSAVLVPDAAIGHDQQGAYVFVVGDKNVVERRTVTTGPVSDGLRAIDDGLKGHERVIVNGLLKAAPGRQVAPEHEGTARPPQPGPSPAAPGPPAAPERAGGAARPRQSPPPSLPPRTPAP